MRKKRKRRRENRHHIVPSSRGGLTTNENIAIVNKIKHSKYHELFGNKTPQEIIEYLVEDFWNGRWEFVENTFFEMEVQNE